MSLKASMKATEHCDLRSYIKKYRRQMLATPVSGRRLLVVMPLSGWAANGGKATDRVNAAK